MLTDSRANTPPTIGWIPNQTVIEDQPTDAFLLSLGDAETPELNLKLSGSSSDPTVVPPENIFFGVAGGRWYFTVTPAFGHSSGTATITVTVSDGIDSAATNFLLTVNAPPPGAARFYSSSPITIPSVGAATPYPSQINVAGRNGTITNVTLALSKFSHGRVQDLNMLLVGPTGQGVVVLSHVSGGNRSATNVTVYLTDSSLYPLPSDFAVWSEPLKPTAYPPMASFPGAPAGPYGPVAFSTFNGLSANGLWSLYVYDETSGASGVIAGGWRLMIATDGGGSSPPQISAIANRTITANTGTGPIPFTIADIDTPVSDLTLSTNSSNPTLVPLSNIVLGGSGDNRTVTVTPAAGQSGTSTITLTVSDGVNSVSSTFMVIVIGEATQVRVETAADGSGMVVPAQNLTAGNSITVYSIARDGSGSFVTNVAADSWSLVNISGGVVNGDLVAAGDGRSAIFTGHAAGSAVIHATSGTLNATDSGTLTVILPGNTPPTISPIPDQKTLIGISVGPFPFNVGDAETPAVNLTVSATSSDQTLMPDGNFSFFNLGSTRTLVATPVAGHTGSATITVTVSDGVNNTRTSFLLTVNPPGGGKSIFSNSNSITIPSIGQSTPYPSSIDVDGIPGTITGLMITLHNMSHTYPGDVDMLLVGPTGQRVVIFSSAVGGYAMNDLTFTLSDGAVYPLPVSFSLPAGTYRASDYSADHTHAPHIFPGPAPSPPYVTNLSTFNGLPPNGTWSLYVFDVQTPNAGVISGGWSLAITTESAPTISSIADQVATVNTTTAAIPFVIYDAETSASNLVLTVRSSNPTLVPTNNIVFGGSGSNRTVTLTPLPNQIGTATITLTVSDGVMTTNKDFLLTVNPPELIVTIDNVTRSYGTGNPPFTGTLTGLQAGDNITATYTTTATASSTVGTYVIVPVFSDPGGKLGNYTVITYGGTLTVTQAVLTVSATGHNKVYDGTTNATVTLSDNRASGDNLATAYGSAGFEDKNVGTSKPVTVSVITVSGADAANYTFNSSASTRADITTATLTVSATGHNKVYDGTTNATVTLSDNRVSGDNLTTAYGSAGFEDKNVGTNKPVTVSGITVSGADAGNYTFNSSTITRADITAATLVVSATGHNKVYDGTTNATVTLSDNRVSGDNLTTAYASAGFEDKNAGTNKPVTVSGITVSGADAANYTFNSSTGTSADITSATLVVSATGHNKVYDGTTNATVTLSDNQLTGDNLTTAYGSAGFENKKVGTNKPVTVSGITVSGADAGNYTFNSSVSTSADITAATLTVTADSKRMVYGQPVPALTVSYSGFVSGEDISVLAGSPSLGTTATVSSPSGDYPITVTKGSLDAANYVFSFVNGTLVVTTVRPSIISLTGAGTGNVLISWSAISNVTYRVQYLPDLNTMNWLNLVPDVRASNNTASAIGDDPGGALHRFYRILIVP